MRRRLLTLAIALGMLSSAASGHYNFVFYGAHDGSFVPVPAKFDRNLLQNGNIPYFISDQPPGPLVAGDNVASLMNEIRAAAEAWNQAPGSAVRLTFGGFESVGAVAQSGPGIDVVFDDNMPPGLLAQTRPSMPDDIGFLSNGAGFVPILRSRIQLRRDLSSPFPQASYYDSVFLTIVHEFGHALGLQHTMTSGVMATALTRATTKAMPLSADDIAGLATLYPAAGYLENTGTITGVVLRDGSGLNLASVVALSTNGTVISGMTNPDGTYRIGGVPPGQYYVYAHPLPPAQQGEAYPANVFPPQDMQKNTFAANIGFDTQFFPGTRDWTQAAAVTVNGGASTDGINFNMQSRTAPVIYNLLTYGYQGQVAVPSPPLPGSTRSYLVFTAPGITSGGKLATGLNVSVIGSAGQTEPATLQYYRDGYAYVVVNTAAVSVATPVAVAVTIPNELYVLPAALMVVPTGPPAISNVSAASTNAQGNTTLTVSGTNLGNGTRIVFDGIPGTVTGVNQDGSLNVTAPPASSGYTAFVEALSSDGQTSSQGLGSAAPPVFTYAAPGTPAVSVTPSALMPGTDTLLQIDGVNTNLTDGLTSVGFGSSDILIRRMWVVTPTRLLMNVSVSPAAQPGVLAATVVSGLQVTTLAGALQVQASNPRQMSLRAPIVNQITGLAGVPAGGAALIGTSGVPQNLSSWTLTIGGQKTSFIMGGGNQIYAQIPTGLPIGPAVVQLSSPGGDQIPPVLMQIDPPPPVIQAAVNVSGTPIDAAHSVRPGETVILSVAQLADASVTSVPASSVHVIVAGMDHVASSVLPGALPGAFQIQFSLGRNVPFGPQQPLMVGIGTRQSAPFAISILPQ